MTVPPGLPLESTTVSRGGHRLARDPQPGPAHRGGASRRRGAAVHGCRNPCLLPGRTALKGIEFVLPDAAFSRARESRGWADLPAEGDTYPLALSGEMGKRVSMVRRGHMTDPQSGIRA